jgi:CBS-domain-containing membrane protein
VQVTTLLRRYRRDRLVVIASFAMINGAVAVGSIAAVALLTHTPFVFPSLGPTAFLVFTAPLAPAASPRNTLLGHTYGVAAGWLSLLLFHLANAPPALTAGVDWPRAGAAALSLSLTSGAMLITRARHPPATATTLIISLGLMPRLWQVPVLLGAVLMLVVEAFAINRLAGLHYPLWAGRPDAPHLLRPPESATIHPTG